MEHFKSPCVHAMCAQLQLVEECFETDMLHQHLVSWITSTLKGHFSGFFSTKYNNTHAAKIIFICIYIAMKQQIDSKVGQLAGKNRTDANS